MSNTMIDYETLNELEIACAAAKDYAAAYGDALKAVAEKNDMDPQALRRFVTARVNDKLEKFEAEASTADQLTMQFGRAGGLG